MPSFLEKIIARKKREVTALRTRSGSFQKRSSLKRPFIPSLDRRPHLAIIAEVKKASPSKGVICTAFDPAALAGNYERGGASAISVLTDDFFFQGNILHLTAVREQVALPVLRKDFIIDPVQVEESAQSNADAVLLIAEALDAQQLTDLSQAVYALDMDPLIELHSARQLDKVMRCEPKAVGINNRDLSTFDTDIGTTRDLVRHIPGEVMIVAESGIAGGSDAVLLRDAGVHALLVGESLVRAKDAKELIRELQL